MDSKVNRVTARSVSKRPATLSLKEPAKKMEDSIPLLAPVSPLHRKIQAMHCPMSPVTPDLDIQCCSESAGNSQPSSTSPAFTFDLLSPTTPRHDHVFSFTACPSSPLDESMVYAFPPRKRTPSSSFQTWGLPAEFKDLSIEICTPLSEDLLREGSQSPSDDRKYFHVRFLQEDSPFPKTPDC